ncbi:MAG: hypothetical protein ACLGGO_18065 [Coleofasciculus sp.]
MTSQTFIYRVVYIISYNSIKKKYVDGDNLMIRAVLSVLGKTLLGLSFTR